MWCTNCQQDVPGILADGSEEYCCPRCGQALSATAVPFRRVDRGRPNLPLPTDRPSRLLVSRLAPLADAWETDETLRRSARVLGIGENEDSASSRASYSPATTSLADFASLPRRPEPSDPIRPSFPVISAWERFQARILLPQLSWVAVALGLILILVGGAVLGLSRWCLRPELWRVGEPTALGGVCSLVVGLVLQVDRRWQPKQETGPRSE